MPFLIKKVFYSPEAWVAQHQVQCLPLFINITLVAIHQHQNCAMLWKTFNVFKTLKQISHYCSSESLFKARSVGLDSLLWCRPVCSHLGKNRIWGSSSQRLRPCAVLPPSRDHYTGLLSRLPTIYTEQVHKFIWKLPHMPAMPTSPDPFQVKQSNGQEIFIWFHDLKSQISWTLNKFAA